MQVVELLRDTRSKIGDASRWTKGADARDERGNEVECTSSSATCWCLLGAMLSIAGPERRALFDRAVELLGDTEAAAGFNIWWLNDNSSHSQMLAILDEAMERERVAGALGG